MPAPPVTYLQPYIELIPGANITIDIDVAPDGGDNEVTISSSGGGGSAIVVQEGDASVVVTVDTLDFGTGFDVTESPANEANIVLDLSEISAGGELGGTLDAPTVDTTHSGSSHAGAAASAVSTHEAASDPHTGYLKESNTIDFLVGTATSELGGEIVVGATPGGELGNTWASPTVDSTHSGSSHAGAAAAETADIRAADVLVGTATTAYSGEIVVGTTPGGELGGTWDTPTVDATHSGSAHTDFIAKAFVDAKGDLISATADNTPSRVAVGTDDFILMADAAAASGLKWAGPTSSPSTQAFGDAAAAGTADLYTRGDHKHAMPAAPSASSVGAIATTFVDAKGDLISASANDTPTIVSVGADDTILMADAAATSGLKWVASASPSAVSTAAATGTSDTFTRGDHVHAHETGHTAHDTIWDTAGDLVVGTGADTAAKLAITVPAANILEVLGVVNGETTATWKAVHDGTVPVTQAFSDAASAGTALTASHRDHKHGMPAVPTVVNIAAYWDLI